MSAASVRGRDVLAAVFAGCRGLVELRAIPSKARIFVPSEDTAAIDAFARAHRHEAVYFGVATRRDGTGGDLAHCEQVGALHLDVDCHGDLPAIAAAEARLAAFVIPPSIVLRSGGGLHAYWLLREPADVQPEAARLRMVLRQLATALDGDLAAAECARVLRVPGTFNHKYGRPRCVTIATFHPEHRVNVAELLDVLPAAPASVSAAPSESLDLGVISGGERNTVLYRLGRALRAKRLPAAAIATAVRAANATCRPAPLEAQEVEALLRQVMMQPDREDFIPASGPTRHRRPDAASPPPVFTKPAVPGRPGDYVLLPRERYDGWMPRGTVSLVGGASGAGKSTLILDLLQSQARGGTYLGHVGGRADFLTVFADRGTHSNVMTLERMAIDPRTIAIEHIPVCWGADAVARIQQAVERHPEIPGAVFVEGGDMLVEDPCKPQIVAPFMKGLRDLAEHYHCAVIVSVGAPKARPNEQYTLKRDRILGTVIWARMADTVLIMSIAETVGAVARRTLDVLHRNALDEHFALEFSGGRLVESAASGEAATPADFLSWAEDAELFSKQKFRDAFKLSGRRATEVLDGLVTAGLLRARTRDDRTWYVYRPPADRLASKVVSGDFGRTDSPSTDKPAQPPTDKTVHPESVRNRARTDTPLETHTPVNIDDICVESFDPLIPPPHVSVVRNGESPDTCVAEKEAGSDTDTNSRGIRAREAQEDQWLDC